MNHAILPQAAVSAPPETNPAGALLNAPPLTPVRGLVPLHNQQGQVYRVTDIHRCLNFLMRAQQVLQADVFGSGPIPKTAFPMVEYAVTVQCGTSYRTDCTGSPRRFGELASRGLESVLLTPDSVEGECFEDWLSAVRATGLPIRVQVTGAQHIQYPETLARTWKEAGVRQVSFRPADPFVPLAPQATAATTETCLASLNALAAALQEEGLAVSFFGFPVRALSKVNAPLANSLPELFQDHQQYRRYPYDFAQYLYRQHPQLVRFILLLKLANLSHNEDPVDRLLMKAVVNYPELLYRPVFLLSKAFRARGAGFRLNDAMDLEEPGLLQQSLEAFRAAFPGFRLKSPHFSLDAPFQGMTFFDRTNTVRLGDFRRTQAEPGEALEWLRNAPPELDSECLVGPVNTMFSLMAGAQQWYSASDAERISHGLPWVELPFMISVTFGGGVAELVGFRINRTQAILCPMVAPAHTLVLYGDPQGHYVLLRDGEAVTPVEVEGKTVLPGRLPNALQFFLSVWNIHDMLSVTPIKIWSSAALYAHRKESIRFSAVIFCTRFSRRLQAALLTIAHQQGFPLEQLEVVVAYVPGIDFTEDVIESVRRVFPALRILHAPMGAHNERSKGYAINEAMKMASGDWIMLMDADILLPPDYFQQVERHTEGRTYLAPIGRGLLGREATSKVLLGEIAPWRAWDTLWDGVEEVRDEEAMGVPIGFNQLLRRECIEQVQYQEYEHFQGADWEFGKAMREKFGKEYRLPLRVLHLDHDGSQWYGVQRQF